MKSQISESSQISAGHRGIVVVPVPRGLVPPDFGVGFKDCKVLRENLALCYVDRSCHATCELQLGC